MYDITAVSAGATTEPSTMAVGMHFRITWNVFVLAL